MNTNQNAENTTLTTILAEISQVLSHIPEDDLEITAKRLEQAPRIFVIGEGRSGLMARAFAMRLMHLGAVSYVIGETITPAIAEGDVLVAISGSGRTHHVVWTAEKAKAQASTYKPSPRIQTESSQKQPMRHLSFQQLQNSVAKAKPQHPAAWFPLRSERTSRLRCNLPQIC